MKRQRNILRDIKGFTLPEVLIVMVISLFVVAGMYSIFLTSNQAAIRHEGTEDLNSILNTSFNIVVNHTRMAGYRMPLASAVNPINNFAIVGGFNPATGFVGNTLKTALTADIKPGSDAMMLLYADNDCTDPTLVDNSLPAYNVGGPANMRVCQPNCFTAGTAPYAVGDVVLITSTVGDIFAVINGITINQTVGGACSGGPFTLISYRGVDELNLATKFDCQVGTPCLNQTVTRLETSFVYYVNNNDQLMRAPLRTTFNPELVSDGIEDIQIRYDQFSACTTPLCGGCFNCDAPATGGSLAQLEDIRAVRLGFVTKTLKEDRTSYYNLGSPVDIFDRVWVSPPADSFRRRTITRLIRVKNLEIQDL